ncbi:spermidine/putrescine ABC transporter substrate-binding protein [Compostimonas suwonensis]|uniref:Spermidine/putrescine ABC transporter substrate-binding protein n=1 Tax=Compostimonas suwonensis TaxID=1048394 RepID=A0A2M9C599_9MICO|nr:spermidine/putrescine ABC transporter substrate-binding protein [Compostimonas suwonensis]PJJ65711.1 hypothetical protein CLV54_0748 [Compostimonas suwonensis]
MEPSVEGRVSHAVDLWIRWLPRWHPASVATRSRLCRRCFGSPVIAAAGLADDVPHAVQHAFSTRMKRIVDDAVESYTSKNLPLLSRELRDLDRRSAALPYRPREGLDPEYDGLDIDPEPLAGQPFLFTLDELAEDEAAEAQLAPQTELTPEEKSALRLEIRLADEYANEIGALVCRELAGHRVRIVEAVDTYVEPQIAQLIADLAVELDSPMRFDGDA